MPKVVIKAYPIVDFAIDYEDEVVLGEATSLEKIFELWKRVPETHSQLMYYVDGKPLKTLPEVDALFPGFLDICLKNMGLPQDYFERLRERRQMYAVFREDV